MQTAEIDQTPVKKKIGRPSKYTPELLRKAKDYLENWQEYDHKIPSIAGMAKVLDTTRERLHLWRADKNKSEFRNIMQQLMAIQEASLLDNGLDGTFNPTITKLVLSKHGYHDNPSSNQSPTGITVNVNRGGVVLKSGDQTLAIETEKTLEHGE